MMALIDTQDAVSAMYDLCESLDTENPHIDAIVDALEEIAPAQKRKFNDMSGGDFENWLRSHGICNPCIDDSIPCDALPLLIDDAIEETVAAQADITDEQFKEYCRKRCLSVVTNEFIYEVRKMVPTVRPEQTNCEYCHTDRDGYVFPLEKNSHAFIDRDKIVLKANGWRGEAKIKYCPICGRRLTDAVD
jgi:hypothetical protein